MTTDTPAEPSVRFRDLGPLEVERAGAASPVGGARLESALALLLIHGGRTVGADALCEAMWGERGVDRSVSTLDSHVWRLRRVLEPGRARGEASKILVRDPGGHRLVLAGDDPTDSRRFVRLATAAADLLTAGDAATALQQASEAAALWRGRPYGVAADEDWAHSAVARLDGVRAVLRETADVAGLVAPGRLITLVGAAGCGKTRLALEVAREEAAPGGSWFVDLTVGTPERVPDTVASALELPAPGPVEPADALRRFTSARRMLVVLDNCEHVLDAVAELVEEVLVEGSQLAVLATSREPLEVDGEEVVALAPLTSAAAVELFLDRLDALMPGGVRDDESMADVRDIAEAVDGLPLASADAGLRDNVYALELYGLARGRAGEDATALRVLGAAEAQHRAAGVPWPRNEEMSTLLATITTRLGTTVADRARAEGARTSVAEFLA